MKKRRPRETPLSLEKKKEKNSKKLTALIFGPVLRGQLVDQRRDHPAGAAPGRPKVDEHGHR